MIFETHDKNHISLAHLVVADKPKTVNGEIYVGVHLQGIPSTSVFRTSVSEVMVKNAAGAVTDAVDDKATAAKVEKAEKDAADWYAKLIRAWTDFHKSAK